MSILSIHTNHISWLSDEKQSNLTYKGNGEISSLQVLKAICAFLVVQIHADSFLAPHIIPFCRIAVPIFFIITGYFIINKNGMLTVERLKHSFFKILKIAVFANLFYFCYNFCTRGSSLFHDFSLSGWLNLLIVGEELCYVLWYLNTLLQAIFAFWLVTKFKLYKWLPAIACIGISLNIIFGEFNFANFALHNFTHRNFLTIAMPCMYLGMIVRLNEHKINLTKRTSILLIITATALLYLEHSICSCHDITTGNLQIFTLPLAIAVFIHALKCRTEANWLAKIGRNHSSNIYILHPFVHYCLYSAHIIINTICAFEVYVGAIILSIIWQRIMSRIAPKTPINAQQHEQ